MHLAVLAGAYERRALLLVHSMDVCTLLDQIRGNVQMANTACHRQRGIIVEVLSIRLGSCLNQSLDNCELCAILRVY